MGGDPRPDTDLPANLVALCGSGTTGCHGWVESHRDAARALGLLVRADRMPCRVALVTWYGRVLLDNVGGFEPIGEVA